MIAGLVYFRFDMEISGRGSVRTRRIYSPYQTGTTGTAQIYIVQLFTSGTTGTVQMYILQPNTGGTRGQSDVHCTVIYEQYNRYSQMDIVQLCTSGTTGIVRWTAMY